MQQYASLLNIITRKRRRNTGSWVLRTYWTVTIKEGGGAAQCNVCGIVGEKCFVSKLPDASKRERAVGCHNTGHCNTEHSWKCNLRLSLGYVERHVTQRRNFAGDLFSLVILCLHVSRQTQYSQSSWLLHVLLLPSVTSLASSLW
jgi:hypothetical protein